MTPISQSALAIHFKWKSDQLEQQLLSMTDALLSAQQEIEKLKAELDNYRQKEELNNGG